MFFFYSESMKNFADRKCVPCDGKITPLSPEQAQEYLKEVPGWTISPDRKKISCHFDFHDFVEAIKFVNEVARVAENEGHHPDIHIFYNKLDIDLWTHAIGGLSENDFIVAAKLNTLKQKTILSL